MPNLSQADWNTLYSVLQRVSGAPQILLSVSPVGPVATGTVITLSASVSAGFAPTGTVTFNDGTKYLAAPVLLNGVAIYSYAVSGAGLHNIKATYNGDQNNTATSSQVVGVQVNPPSATFLLSVQPNPSYSGEDVVFSDTASMSTVTGMVDFQVNGASVTPGGAPLINGVATFDYGQPAPNQYSVTANYSGDANNQPVSSGPVTLTVNSGSRPAETVWVEDAIPAGGSVGGTEPWIWVTSPLFSGSQAHQSQTISGMHQHYFIGATSRLQPSVGNNLFCYVYLDPTKTPTEVMLQWYSDSWEHRAYWGANSIGWGTDGTNSRRYMGALPPVGQWVKLSVPAAQVGLEGSTLTGMAFTLYDGKATWDHAGKTN